MMKKKRKKWAYKVIAIVMTLTMLTTYSSLSVFAEGGGADEGQEGGPEQYTLTVNYYYESTEGALASSPFIGAYQDGEEYSVQVPAKDGYVAKVGDKVVTDAVTGEITADTTIDVIYYGEEKSYTVTSMIEQLDGTYSESWQQLSGKVGEMTQAVLNDDIIADGYSAANPKNVTITSSGEINIVITYHLNNVKVKFDTDGGSYVASVSGKSGMSLNINDIATPKKVGYAFDGWYLDSSFTNKASGSLTIKESQTLYGKWIKGQANYSVIYWLENADDDGYTYFATDVRRGITDANVSYNKRFSGIDFSVFAEERVTGDSKIKADGSSTVNVYYSRKSVTLHYQTKKDNKWTDKYTFTGKMGAKFVDDKGANLWPTEEKILWRVEASSSASVQAYMQYFPSGKNNVYFYAHDGGTLLHKIKYMVQNIDNNEYALDHTDDMWFYDANGSDPGSGWVITIEDCYDIRGFTYNSKRGWDEFKYDSQTNVSTGSIYYTRNRYSLDFYYSSKELKKERVPYNKVLTGYNFTPTAVQAELPSYYSFMGWYTSPECLEGTEFDVTTEKMPSNNVKLYAKFGTEEVSVFFDTDGGGAILPEKTTKGQTIKMPKEPEKDGYEFVNCF